MNVVVTANATVVRSRSSIANYSRTGPCIRRKRGLPANANRWVLSTSIRRNILRISRRPSFRQKIGEAQLAFGCLSRLNCTVHLPTRWAFSTLLLGRGTRQLRKLLAVWIFRKLHFLVTCGQSLLWSPGQGCAARPSTDTKFCVSNPQ